MRSVHGHVNGAADRTSGEGARTYEEGGRVPKVGVDLEDVGIARRVEVEEVAREVALKRVLRERASPISTGLFDARKGRHTVSSWENSLALPSCAQHAARQTFSQPASASGPVPFPRWMRLVVVAAITSSCV